MGRRNTLWVLGAACIGAAAILAARPAALAGGPPCPLKGTNIEGQAYDRWARPIGSYLVPLDDGYMCVQAGGSIQGAYIKYYNKDFQLTGAREVAPELPVFGGFYAADDGYYTVTGQENPGQSADLPVIRITKYDKGWNLSGRAEIKDCNTVSPFEAGTVRMDTCGDYLLARTSRGMYASRGGTSHQANLTFEINRKSMVATDVSGVMAGTGYVSHSFNQFLKMDGNKAVALDHGDAYPRALVLNKYCTDASDGTFQPSGKEKCRSANILSFPGKLGDNDTGASAGGLEVSDSSYLVAGNSVRQDRKEGDTRNVFVASVDKKSLKVKLRWLTSYADGDGTTSTPQLARLSGKEFLVLWSREHTVYYTKINDKGARISGIRQCAGNLSDCVPVASRGEVIWYTWADGGVTFYRINQRDLSCTITTAGRDTATGVDTRAPRQVAKGRTGSAGGLRYQVTKAGSRGTAEAACTGIKGGRKTASIPASVLIGGVRCKITSIAPGAFKGNGTLKAVTVGKNVRVIGRGAFRGCRKLRKLAVRSKKLKRVGRDAVRGISPRAVVKVPQGLEQAYRKTFRKKSGFGKRMRILAET